MVASRLELLLQVKFIQSYKNMFQTVSLVQKEFIINLVLETISQEGRNMDIASEEKRSSLLVLAIVQPISLIKNSTARNDLLQIWKTKLHNVWKQSPLVWKTAVNISGLHI